MIDDSAGELTAFGLPARTRKTILEIYFVICGETWIILSYCVLLIIVNLEFDTECTGKLLMRVLEVAVDTLVFVDEISFRGM